MNESVVDLIKDLTARLGDMADEFGARAQQVQRAPEAAIVESDSEAQLTALAKRLVSQRKARRDFFPADLFHEPAWEMMMALFIARDEAQAMNIKTLVACADAPVTTAQRWLEYLAKLGMVTRTIDPLDRRRMEVQLSDKGRESMTLYLRSLVSAPTAN